MHLLVRVRVVGLLRGRGQDERATALLLEASSPPVILVVVAGQGLGRHGLFRHASDSGVCEDRGGLLQLLGSQAWSLLRRSLGSRLGCFLLSRSSRIVGQG